MLLFHPNNSVVCFHYHLHFRRCFQRIQAQQKKFAPVKKQNFRWTNNAQKRWIKIASLSTREQHNVRDNRHPLLLFKQHNQLLRNVFRPNRNVFDTMLQFNGLAWLPSYLQRSCYIPKHHGKHSSNGGSWICNFLRLSINAHKKQSLSVFQGLHCL